MKIEKTCESCYHNRRKCSYLLAYNCRTNNLSDWKPYTNAEHIRNMTDDELADYIMRASGTVYKLICDNCHEGCWWDCKTNHHCNGGDDGCTPTKEDVLRWLHSEVKTDD